jgi:hypothetical protein
MGQLLPGPLAGIPHDTQAPADEKYRHGGSVTVARGQAHPRYIVAEIKNDGVEFGWTSGAYTDLRVALLELKEARDAGLTSHQIFELRVHPSLTLSPPPS